jgi:putative endonuclease
LPKTAAGPGATPFDYEFTDDASAAIVGEKQIKAGSRRKKIELANGFNPGWQELYDEL